jgi:hypothetical protein
VNINKILLFAIITLGFAILAAIVIGNWGIVSTSFASESARNWFITLIVAPVVVIIIGGLLTFIYRKFLLPFFQGRTLYVNVERCVHSPAHSREQKHPTGTKMSVTFSFENNLGKKTALTGVQLVAPYKTEKEPPKAPFVLKGGRKSYYLEDVTPGQYTHRFFIKDKAIGEDKLKCVFRLFYVPHAEKKIIGVSDLQR